ncbi:hypothetical protein CDAR_616251 [Caerostris darwini]|uniref:Insulin-like domain-containing protein n=1 Tax=Caerostris darwini TaxID=1538125 RepID=A0AAV4PQ01_9ARAC|nr:hypothetical protein CDAR_616251 [Caerostris darwini]
MEHIVFTMKEKKNALCVLQRNHQVHTCLSVSDPFQNWIAVALSSQDRNEAGFQSVPDQLATPQLYKRFQAGVVDECCRKACSPSTLLSYCRRVE